MSGERRLRLALIVIVEGILVCNSSAVKASKKVGEMLKDVDSFVKYPWGRKSFKRSLEMVKLGAYNQSVFFLVDKLCQSHTATHGFILSFQLLALHAIPLLQRYLPDLNDEQTFTDRSVLQLTQLKTFHNSNILQTENDPNVSLILSTIYFFSHIYYKEILMANFILPRLILSAFYTVKMRIISKTSHGLMRLKIWLWTTYSTS